MARVTQDREDLLLEATALAPRVILKARIQGEPCEVFAGFRGQCLSVYFGASPVYHFNHSAELRRAFIDDCLLKAEENQLVSSVRERSASQVCLVSTPLTRDQTNRLAADAEARLHALRDALEHGDFILAGQIPADGNGVTRLRNWLADWPGFKIARVANVD